ncbi:MAG TPA: hypothetical protein VIM67_12035, partial [Terriglobus sp.]
ILKAVIVRPNETVHLQLFGPHVGATGKYLPAGTEYPGKPIEPELHAMTTVVPVVTVDGQAAKLTDSGTQQFLAHGSPIVLVHGELRYSDFSMIHEQKFCQPVFMMNPGTFHEQTKAELACAKFNHQEDTYRSLPSISSTSLVDTSKITTINCPVIE